MRFIEVIAVWFRQKFCTCKTSKNYTHCIDLVLLSACTNFENCYRHTGSREWNSGCCWVRRTRVLATRNDFASGSSAHSAASARSYDRPLVSFGGRRHTSRTRTRRNRASNKHRHYCRTCGHRLPGVLCFSDCALASSSEAMLQQVTRTSQSNLQTWVAFH